MLVWGRAGHVECEVPVWPPGGGGHRQLMVVKLRDNLSWRLKGRKAALKDVSKALEWRRFSIVKGSVESGMGFKDKGRGGSERRVFKIRAIVREEGGKGAKSGWKAELQNGGTMAFHFG